MKYLPILLLLFIFSCKKNESPQRTLTELEKLPPETQIGANTFGCLINGKAWRPSGSRGGKPNFYIIVDPGWAEGNISVRTYRAVGEIVEYFTINSDSIKNTGLFPVLDKGKTETMFLKLASDGSGTICGVYYGDEAERTGWLRITKYDLANKIVSGTFETSMINPLCGYGDTIKITHGRFDFRLY